METDLKLKEWNYEESVERMKPRIYKLKSLTLKVYHELWTAREKLRNQGARTDLTSGIFTRSWGDYCDEIGIAKRTANKWLERYDPENRRLFPAPKVSEISGQIEAPKTREILELIETGQLTENDIFKLLREQYPKAIKRYKKALNLAIASAERGLFSPESIHIIKTKHNQIRDLMANYTQVVKKRGF